ncbi:MAG: DUF1284 domain-containing protein [Candidatus Omnitrophica bacterium]|nr:DUF1284 domain-containing protein [Candidatus Omnitrophota bacterium]
MKIRAHHLICLVAYNGQGYGPEFEKTFNDMQHRYLTSATGEIEVIAGPDAACESCTFFSGDGCSSSQDGPEEKIVAFDNKALRLLKLSPGTYRARDILRRVRSLSTQELDDFCKGCSWYHKTNCVELIQLRIETLF